MKYINTNESESAKACKKNSFIKCKGVLVPAFKDMEVTGCSAELKKRIRLKFNNNYI